MGYLRRVNVSIRSEGMSPDMDELLLYAASLKPNYDLERCANVDVCVAKDPDRVAIDVDIEVFRSDIGDFRMARYFIDQAKRMGFTVKDELVLSSKGYYEKEPGT